MLLLSDIALHGVRVTTAQLLRYFHIPALLDINSDPVKRKFPLTTVITLGLSSNAIHHGYDRLLILLGTNNHAMPLLFTVTVN
jgi:hypothetical protein